MYEIDLKLTDVPNSSGWLWLDQSVCQNKESELPVGFALNSDNKCKKNNVKWI